MEHSVPVPVCCICTMYIATEINFLFFFYKIRWCVKHSSIYIICANVDYIKRKKRFRLGFRYIYLCFLTFSYLTSFIYLFNVEKQKYHNLKFLNSSAIVIYQLVNARIFSTEHVTFVTYRVLHLYDIRHHIYRFNKEHHRRIYYKFL